MKTILSYLAMESTWRGLILIATSAGVVLEPAQANAIVAAGLGLIGLILTFRKS